MAPTHQLDFGPLLSFVGFRLRTAQLVMYDDFLRDAPVAGLTPGQFAILLLVEQNPGLTQQSLSDGIRVEKSTLVVRLHRLEERGLLRRIRSDNDRRSNVLQVTAEGKKCLRTMLAFVRQHENRVLSEFSASERQQLLKLLGKVMLVGAQQSRPAVGAKRAESTGRTTTRRASNGSAGRARTVAGAKRASGTRRV
jgi:DNA-binding MarR family transcriptional regulator